MGLSVPAQLTVRNSSVRLFEVSNRGSPHFRPAAFADFLWLEEASTRGSSHFHAVLLNKAALPDEIQGRDALGDDRGDLIVKRAMFLKNYPLTSSENVICVHQRPRSPATNMLDLGVWKLVALPDKKFAGLSRSAQLQDEINSVRHAAAAKRKQERRKAETQEEHIYGPGGRLPESSRDAIKDICLAYSKQVQNTMFCLCCAYSRTLLSGTKPEWQWDETTTCQWLCNAAFRREGPRRGLDPVRAGADASRRGRSRLCRRWWHYTGPWQLGQRSQKILDRLMSEHLSHRFGFVCTQTDEIEPTSFFSNGDTLAGKYKNGTCWRG